jgi:four helix bundle protein
VTYRRFKDLPVWRTALDLAVRVYQMTAAGCLKGHAGLRDQIERAAVSVSNNIAEGFERGTNQELLTFLYIARGSSGEVRSMLCLLEHLPGLSVLESEISNLKSLSESTSRQLGGWIEQLKSSELKGTRFQNDATRQATQTARRRNDYLDKLRLIQDEARTGSGSILDTGGVPE